MTFKLAAKTLVLFSLFIFGNYASAEYRAFELEITDTESGNSRRVLTTMDHLQYSTYYPVKASEQVFYVTSWMCKGRTNQRPVCPNLNNQTQANTQP